MKVIDNYKTGSITQHVVPAYDMSVLYALNNSSNTITPIDPKTGQEAGRHQGSADPYNLYFMPDGSEAIVVEEANQTLDLHRSRRPSPSTRRLGRSATASTTWTSPSTASTPSSPVSSTARLVKVDLVNKKVVGSLRIDITKSGKANPMKPITQPQDGWVSPDGKAFYIADLITDGVFTDRRGLVHPDRLHPDRHRHPRPLPEPRRHEAVRHQPGHRDDSRASARSRGRARAAWRCSTSRPRRSRPRGRSTGAARTWANLTEDGTQLWLGGRYDNEVYVFDTVRGRP